jgi:uncharacterized integral membrane protein
MKRRNASKFPSRKSEACKVHVIWMGFRTTKNIKNKCFVNLIVSSLIIIIIIIIIIINFYLTVSSQLFSLDFHFSKTVILKTY